jgi:hypothetical protein
MGPPERRKDKKGPRHMPARRTSGSVNMGKSRFKGSLDDIGHVLKRVVVSGRFKKKLFPLATIVNAKYLVLEF